jgi:PilZ domain
VSSPSQRRSDRVSLTLLIEISGTDSHGESFSEPTRTLLINRHGAVIVSHSELVPGQQICVRRRAPGESHREALARVVSQFGRQQEDYLYGIEIVASEGDLWGIEFPPVANSAEMVARMLLQCTYCRSREVVYLNEMELRGFDMNRGIARYCKSCGVPSIWTQAPHEHEEKSASRASRAKSGNDSQAAAPPGDEQRRQRTRLKTRLTACIRQPGADDELAVCDDISPAGMCFRSKRDYEAGVVIEVAVPFSPDAANIFLPARVVYSEKAPKAGFYRYGTQYLQSRSNWKTP